MYYKLKYEDGNISKDAHYNKVPRGWKHLSEAEFCKTNPFSGSIKYMEFRQISLDQDMMPPKDKKTPGKFQDVHLFWYNQFQGFAIITDYWKGTVNYFSFTPTKEEMAEDIEKYVSPIESDSKWCMDSATSNPRRGIRDYNRLIKFKNDLTDKEMKMVTEWLVCDECPGWTGVGRTRLGKGYYKFRTTYDSSD